MDITADIASRRIRIQPVDTAELSPGEFAHNVRAAVAQGADGTPGSPARGGAIYNHGGTAAATNCTFDANSVSGGQGGNGGFDAGLGGAATSSLTRTKSGLAGFAGLTIVTNATADEKAK